MLCVLGRFIAIALVLCFGLLWKRVERTGERRDLDGWREGSFGCVRALCGGGGGGGYRVGIAMRRCFPMRTYAEVHVPLCVGVGTGSPPGTHSGARGCQALLGYHAR